MQKPLWAQPGEAYFVPMSSLPHPEDRPLVELWRRTGRALEQGAPLTPYIVVDCDVCYTAYAMNWLLVNRKAHREYGLPEAGPETPYRCLALLDAESGCSVVLADIDGCTYIAAVLNRP